MTEEAQTTRHETEELFHILHSIELSHYAMFMYSTLSFFSHFTLPAAYLKLACDIKFVTVEVIGCGGGRKRWTHAQGSRSSKAGEKDVLKQKKNIFFLNKGANETREGRGAKYEIIKV